MHANILFAMRTGLPGLDTDGLYVRMRNVVSTELTAVTTAAADTGEERGARTGGMAEKFVEISAFRHFFSSGRLAEKDSLGLSISDDEYLSGVMELPRELARYAISQAVEVVNCKQDLYHCRSYPV